jgi:hypothetical protein
VAPPPDIPALRDRTRVLIKAGKLPATTKPSTIEGSNTVQPVRCHMCDNIIEAGQIKITVRAPGLAFGDTSYGPLHFACHAAWQLEAIEAERALSAS